MSDAPVSLRPTTLDDVPAMAAIEALSFSDPWPARSFHDLLTHPAARMTTALDAGGSVVGYCVTIRAADEAEVANIATSPTMRGRGIGGQLLDDAIAAGTAGDVVTMFLEVRESNAAARALYESRGFIAVGRRRGYYRKPLEDALVMRRQSSALE